MLKHFRLSKHHPLHKNFVNFIWWLFIVFGLFLIFIAREPDIAYPQFQGALILLCVLLMLLPLLFFRTTRLREKYHDDLLHTWEFLWIFPMFLSGLGGQGLFDAGWGYDSVVHFFNSLFWTLFIFLILKIILNKYQLFNHLIFIFIIAVVLGVYSGLVMEFFEKYGDLWFGTRMWGELGQDPLLDTFWDIFYDVWGCLAGGITGLWYADSWLKKWEKVKDKIIG